MKSLVVALAVAAMVLGSAPPAGAKLLSLSDDKIYREAFAHAERGNFKDAHGWAARAKDKVLAKAIRWLEFSQPRSNALFADITAFIRDNSGWPQQRLLQRRAEEAISVATPVEQILGWFRDNPPITVDGKMAYGGALLERGQSEEGIAVLRDAWISGNFGVLQERNFLSRFGSHLRESDHIARLDRLLWDRQNEAAQRMILRVGMAHRHLAQARLALIGNAAGVEAALAKVPRELSGDPGLIYERVRWRRQRDLDDLAIQLLTHPSANKVRPEAWWTERSILARRMLQRGFISQAYDIARHHGLKDGASFAEAEWFAGWVALRSLQESRSAFEHFRRVHDISATAITRARGAYWAGRAAEAMRDGTAAQQWYETAARHSHVYYGQLAAGHLGKDDHYPLPADPLPTADDIAAFEANELVRVVRLLAEIGRNDDVTPFILRLNEAATTPGQRGLSATLASSVGRADLGVSIARRSERDGVSMIASGFPVPPSVAIERPEKALVLALIRQESGFHERAVSSVGARGLMQLMPATAKALAKTLKVSFSPDRLHDPSYNVRLGTTYLADLLNSFNGSYILSLASYNAGPGRVRSWVREYGDPRNPEVDPIDWVESIPFSETRNYVQRVLESTQVYRRRLGATDFARSLERDLKR